VVPEGAGSRKSKGNKRDTLIESNLARRNSNVSNVTVRESDKIVVSKRVVKKNLLPPKEEGDSKKTLILDLDETCAHSSFTEFKNSNFKQCIVYEGISYTIHVLKRPHLQEFLEKMSKIYEIVFYTASVREYADHVLDFIDPDGIGSARLFRED